MGHKISRIKKLADTFEFIMLLFIIIVGVLAYLQWTHYYKNLQIDVKPKSIVFQNYAEPIITLNFDDGWLNQYDHGKRVLSKYNFSGVMFVITDYVEDQYPAYVSKNKLRELQDKYGWDISSHYFSNLSNKDPDELITIFSDTKKWLIANKFKGSDYFAYPQGYYDDNVLKISNEFFSFERTTKNALETLPPKNKLIVNSYVVSQSRNFEAVKDRINSAQQNNEWLIIVFHRIIGRPEAHIDYSIEEFKKVIHYINSTGIKVKTISQVVELVD